MVFHKNSLETSSDNDAYALLFHKGLLTQISTHKAQASKPRYF